MREQLSQKYISGRGIEIGGLHCPLPVPRGAKVTYVDRLPPEEAHPDVRHQVKVKEVVIDDAERLDHFQDGTLDFIVANHVFEHCRDPIGTLEIWWSRLRKEGVVYAAVPDKTKTFDSPRKVTSLHHLIVDHHFGWHDNLRDEEHYREWLSIIDKIQEPELTLRANHCVVTRANIHFHTWDEPAMRELLFYMSKFFELVEFVPNGAEIIWVLRKI